MCKGGNESSFLMLKHTFFFLIQWGRPVPQSLNLPPPHTFRHQSFFFSQGGRLANFRLPKKSLATNCFWHLFLILGRGSEQSFVYTRIFEGNGGDIIYFCLFLSYPALPSLKNGPRTQFLPSHWGADTVYRSHQAASSEPRGEKVDLWPSCVFLVKSLIKRLAPGALE